MKQAALNKEDLQVSLQRVLRDWRKGEALETGVLAQLRLYLDLAAHKGRGSTPGAAARQLVEQFLTVLQERNEVGARLLRQRYLAGLGVKTLSRELAVSESQLYKWQSEALAQLAEIVLEQEEHVRYERQQAVEARLEPLGQQQLFGVDMLRQQLLAAVTEPAEPWLIAVEGLGGIGKTSLADGLARGLARRLGDRFNEGRACTNLGYFFIERGYWQRAELLCCHALRIFEELGSEHGRAHTENHLGLLYTRLCRWAEARQHLEQACAIWQAMDDHHGLAYGFMNLGTLYADMEYPDESLQYSNKALDQANLVREELLLGLITINIGLAYKLKGELSTAELYSRKAEAIFERRSNSFELAHVWENLGTIYIEQQRWPEAHWHLQAALETWRRLGQKSGEIQTMLHLSRYELARGHQEEARAWLMEAERQFNQHDRTGLYHQLRIQANKIRRSLTEKTARQAATDSF